MPSEGPEDVLRFWFPPGQGEVPSAQQILWWFRGGADAEIVSRFGPLLLQAERGELDAWAEAPRSRLALILVLDQFPRTLHRGTARAYGFDAKARTLTREGLQNGHYAALATPWERTFFMLPLGHSEDLADLEEAVRLAEELAETARPEQRELLVHSVSQARGHRDVVARFGRQPHRNEALGRTSTAEERAYLEAGQLVHRRMPPGVEEG